MSGHVPHRRAAGCLIMARRTGRFLFCLRSRSTTQASTWSVWGGKREGSETPIETALREVREETGLRTDALPSHIHRLSSRNFTYDTFLLVVDDEFCPASTRESDGYAWLPIEHVPSPTHWGLEKLLEDAAAVRRIARAVESISGRPCALRPRQPAPRPEDGTWTRVPGRRATRAARSRNAR
jgi:ADP-ribose pyrophosphatase